ncbi:putative glycoside hydrolase [Aerococcaceae bacterium NML180378]|nr:putative glycoside hydrolase [Aerococcaceae bacterium NML180378]
MKYLTKKRTALSKFSIICLSVLALTGCQLFQSKPKEPTHYTLPTIESKYTAEELADFNNRVGLGRTNQYEGLTIRNTPLLKTPANLPKSLFYDSGINIAYPTEGVKGIYLTAENVANTEKFNTILSYLDQTSLNSVVIDFKDDSGQITTQLNTDNPMIQSNIVPIADLQSTLKTLEQHQIYPIARIVTFKDMFVASEHPEYSFIDKETGEIWQDAHGAMFINPFLKEMWDYNIDVAIEAAKMGFKDIQFDYIRFPEGFNDFHADLTYSKGNYENYSATPILDVDGNELEGAERVAAITDFLKYAKERLAPYGVNVSADIFGYTAVAGNAADVTGIGQNFVQMANQLDVVSSMIYPSHWGVGFFGLDNPNATPFDTVDEYMASETQRLQQSNNQSVIRRPWLQDFSDADKVPYIIYGPKEVQDQIDALAKHGIYEFLLWNASGDYTSGVNYMPEAPTQP